MVVLIDIFKCHLYVPRLYLIEVKVNASYKVLFIFVFYMYYFAFLVSLQVHFNFDYKRDRFLAHTESSIKYCVSFVQFEIRNFGISDVYIVFKSSIVFV